MKFESLEQFNEANLANRMKWLREADIKDVATAMEFNRKFRIKVFDSVGKEGIIDLMQSPIGNYEESSTRLLSIEFEPYLGEVIEDDD